MILQRELVKWTVCDGVIRLLNTSRHAQGLQLLNGALIEEHEYYIANLDSMLTRIRCQQGIDIHHARAAIAGHCNKPVGLIRALEKKFRTTHDRCVGVKQAFSDLYGETLTISNEPFVVRPGRQKRSVKAVRPADR
jgi:hypothetical protein